MAGDRSEWKQAIAAYEAQGMSESTAFIEAMKDKAGEIGLDALGGALSGGVMAAPGAVSSAVSATRAGTETAFWDEGNVRGLIDQAKSYGPESASGKAAAALEKKIDAGREISRRDVGYLINSTEQAKADDALEREKYARRTGRTAGEAESNGQNNNAAPESGTAENMTGYTAEEAASIRREAKTFRNLVAGIDISVKDFFSKWRNGRKSHLGEKLDKLYLGKLSDAQLETVESILGYDISHRDVIVTNDDVKHIYDHHGDLPDSVVETLLDVIHSPDSIAGGHEGTGKNAGKTGIIFRKAMSDGTILCAQFDNQSRETLEVTSLYIERGNKKGTTSEVTADLATATRTPKASEPVPGENRLSPNTNISQPAPDVNTEFSGDVQARREALARREEELRRRTGEFIDRAQRGEDVSALQAELMAEADDIQRERTALGETQAAPDGTAGEAAEAAPESVADVAVMGEETEEERRALEDREYRERMQELTVAPTGAQMEERRIRAGNLRELERSGRESGATEEQIAAARRVADATGRRIVFINEGRSGRRGEYKSGTIYVNAAYGDEAGQIIAHELTHSIEESGDYGELSRLVQRRIMENGGDLDGMLREVRERYAAAGVSLDGKHGDDMKELVAEYVERELLTNEQEITSLVRENWSLGKAIMDLIDRLLAKLGSKAARERSFLRNARNIYARALLDTRSSTDSEAAVQQLREALAAGEISEEEFDRAYDALDVGLDVEGGGQYSVAAQADRREVAGRLRSMLSSGASVQDIRQYVNSVTGSGTRQSPAGTRADGARQILNTAHGQNMSVDEYLRQNWDEYEVDGELRPEARRALEMEGGRTQYSVTRRLNNDDMEEYLKAGERSNKVKQRLLDSGEQIILTSEEQIQDFIDSSLDGENQGITVAYGRVNDRIADDVENYSNGKIDIRDNYLELVPDDLQHAYDEHSEAKQEGDIPLSREDFLKIPEYFDTYDDLIYAIKYKSGRTHLCIGKQIENGKIVIIEGVSKSRGAVQFKNAFGVSDEKYQSDYLNKYRKSNPSTGGNKSSNISPRDGIALNNSISNSGGNVKTQFSVAEGTRADTDGREDTREDIRDALPAKAKRYLDRTERVLVNRVGELMQVPGLARRKYLWDIAADMSREFLESGRISDETRERLFETAWSQGVEVEREFYDQYKDVKKLLRERAVTISDADKGDITDYEDFRKSAFGTLRIVKEGGLPVDVAYQELSGSYPELFPEEITHPAEQLKRMYEVGRDIRICEKSLDDALGEDAEEHKLWARNDFNSAINETLGDLRTVKRLGTMPVTPRRLQQQFRRDHRCNVKKRQTNYVLYLKSSKKCVIVGNDLIPDEGNYNQRRGIRHGGRWVPLYFWKGEKT